ncbi:MAG: glycosyltransferase family 2 protein [Desulfoprunum sp.]|uniref:glycosyltransferase family 2 protein n=1 Tax=Desulfoprunum sp. TaxID=2020866 RepID=UPI003C73E662
MGLREYFYQLIAKSIRLYVRPGDTMALVCSSSDLLPAMFPESSIWDSGVPDTDSTVDYVVVSGCIHYERDIQSFLQQLRNHCTSSTRVIITYYSSLWRPLLNLATRLNLRIKTPEQNWLAPEDIENFVRLSGYEPVRTDNRILCPVYIPLVSAVLNRFVAPLPLFRSLSMLNILTVRPLPDAGSPSAQPSVSVIVPARNEAGNIENAVKRLPAMGPDDELIFVEGNSTDNTWQMIQEIKRRYGSTRNILIAQQSGKGKGDAVRRGFSLATRDVLMILDADLTVPPEDLPKFYDAIVRGHGEFINGSRLVYPMEGQAMRFLNMVGNKFFAVAFSFVLGQRFRDTLCGTKVLSRGHYEKLAQHRKYFGEFDPFGDFDLLFGAARLGLKIVEVPICYRDRVYGTTNISRWRHGLILLKMLLFAALRIRFI